MINLYNNRGNCQIKQQNHKEGIKDFTKVLELDPKNLKALYRRGICYYNTQKYNLSFEDLNNAYKLAETDKEKEMIKTEMDKTISSINTLISRERGKMEKFIYNEDTKFKRIKIIDIKNADVLNDDDSLIIKKEEEENNKENVNKNNNNNINKKVNKPIEPKKILKKEEIKQFVYDSTLNNINSSSFKYAFRNLGNDINAKKEYLLKINPINLPKIFKTDLDKDSLLDIFRCFQLFENEYQIVEYIKNIIKIPRIKLIIQLISKKYKSIIFEVLENLEKGDYGSEVITIKDFFNN
jgi:tetratricopeptide (TPR) repeat protein